MKNIQDTTHSLLNWFLDARSNVLDMEGEHRPIEMAKHISCCYKNIDFQNLDINSITKDGDAIDVDLYLTQDKEYRKLVVKLFDFINQEMCKYISHSFLIGSLSTLDYKKGWSDVDIFIVLKDSAVEDYMKLVELRNVCYKAWDIFKEISPLQHHGFIVVTAKDLLHYPEYYMPPAVFDYSKKILDKQSCISFNVCRRDSGALGNLKARLDVILMAEKTGVYKHHPKKGKYLKARFANSDDSMYQLYCFLGYIMLIPSLYMSSIGKSCYKRDSFILAKHAFSSESWSLIQRASIIRNNWELEEGVKYTGNSIPLWVQGILGDSYIIEAKHLMKEVILNINRYNGV